MTINRFEDLEIWKNAFKLWKEIWNISQHTGLIREFSLKDQILRSSGSVMDNIAEGFERDGKREFLNFLYIAKGSIGETRSQLYRCFESHFINEEQLDSLLQDCFNLSGQIKHFINYLNSTDYKGVKNK